MNQSADTLSLSTIISRAPNLAQRLFEESMLIVTPRDSVLHRLNEVGSALWDSLEKPQTVADLCTVIGQRFEGFDHQKNQKDILDFLEIMNKKGLVVYQH